MFGITSQCHDAVLQAFLYIMAYCVANFFIYLLIKYAESSVYMVIVQALATPLGAFFWTLFQPSPTFHWDPVFNLATAFILGGLAIMVPAAVMYNYFAAKEEKIERIKAELNEINREINLPMSNNDAEED